MQAVQHPPAGAAAGLGQTLRPGDPGHGRGIVTIKSRVPINSAPSATRPRADSAASSPTGDLRVALWFCGRPLASSGQRPADGEERGELTETNGTVSTVAGFAMEDLATELLTYPRCSMAHGSTDSKTHGPRTTKAQMRRRSQDWSCLTGFGPFRPWLQSPHSRMRGRTIHAKCRPTISGDEHPLKRELDQKTMYHRPSTLY